jgi:hypothetical protein
MISLFPFGKAVCAAVDAQVREFAALVLRFVELIVLSLFW